MAIIIERLEGFDNLIRTYSDKNVLIKQDQTGINYPEAIDIEPVKYTYTETNIPIEEEEKEEEKEEENN